MMPSSESQLAIASARKVSERLQAVTAKETAFGTAATQSGHVHFPCCRMC